MRLTKLGAVLASLTITATGAVALLGTAPAQALADTQVSLDLGGSTKVVEPYRTYIGQLSGSIVASDSTQVTVGDSVLQRKLPGKSWKSVKTDGNPTDNLSYGAYGDHALGNVQYRVHYLGGTDGTNTWAGSYSNVVTVATLWAMHENANCTRHGCRIFGKLAPKAKHHKMIIQVVRHQKWKTYKRIKTDAKSRWSASVVATAGKGTVYRAVALRSKSEVATASKAYRFYKQRTARTAGRGSAVARVSLR